MFWGVILESGKRYSQKVLESYHLSMACLEPLPRGDIKPPIKEVSVMIEHGDSEYVLCVLEYGRRMQVHLDIIFDIGEVVTYFLNGEGVVHLTGYALPAVEEDDNIVHDKSTDVPELQVEEEEDEEADEDWTPGKEQLSESSDDEDDEEEVTEDENPDAESEPELQPLKIEDQSDMNQLSETDDDDYDDDDDVESNDLEEKEQKVSAKSNKLKKRKGSNSSPAENGILDDNGKSKKRQKLEVNHVNGEDSGDVLSADESEEERDDGNSSVDYSSEEGMIITGQEISSVGRTPMPKKKVSSMSGLGESPDLARAQNSTSQKSALKIQDAAPANKESAPVTPKNARKLQGNVQVEDLRLGSGPVVKNGKFVFLYYVGKLLNGKVFETCEPPNKPFSFRMGKGEVIKGLEIGLQGMKVGGKRRISIPPNMGYGSQKSDAVPANSTVVFTVDLKSVR